MYKISQVQSKRDLMRFIKFPDELYKDCPQYVPALHSDQLKSLTKSPSLLYCKSCLWLVTDENSKVCGRICAMINPRYNAIYGKKRVRFGWFDAINDFEVAKLLICTAEQWAREQGMDEIHGPLYYNTLGKQGMLVEGFENIPPFNCLYNFPYYNDFVTALGFEKECDWVQFDLPAAQGVPDKTKRLSSVLLQRYNLHLGSIDSLKKDPAKVRSFFKLYSDSFAKTVYNFIPFTDEEIEEEARSTMPFISDKASTVVFDENENVVAFGISFPSISKALQKAKGKLLPFGWIHLLRALGNYETTDLMINGAVPQWQSKGISAIYYTDMAEKAIKIGNVRAITNPQIEGNSAVNIWKDYDHKPFMRRRCYIKKID